MKINYYTCTSLHKLAATTAARSGNPTQGAEREGMASQGDSAEMAWRDRERQHIERGHEEMVRDGRERAWQDRERPYRETEREGTVRWGEGAERQGELKSSLMPHRLYSSRVWNM